MPIRIASNGSTLSQAAVIETQPAMTASMLVKTSNFRVAFYLVPLWFLTVRDIPKVETQANEAAADKIVFTI